MKIKYRFISVDKNFQTVKQIILKKLSYTNTIRFIQDDYILIAIKQNEGFIEIGIKYEDYNIDKFSSLIAVIEQAIISEIGTIVEYSREVIPDTLYK